jgi:hypothetical protein
VLLSIVLCVEAFLSIARVVHGICVIVERTRAFPAIRCAQRTYNQPPKLSQSSLAIMDPHEGRDIALAAQPMLSFNSRLSPSFRGPWTLASRTRRNSPTLDIFRRKQDHSPPILHPFYFVVSFSSMSSRTSTFPSRRVSVQT